MAQLFGTMPVSGILSNDARYVKFDWISVRFIVCIISTFSTSVDVTTFILTAVHENITLGTAG